MQNTEHVAHSRLHLVKSSYRQKLHAVLTPREHRLFAGLDTPQKIQNYLDRMPVNFSLDGDTAMSPRRTIAANMAHCAEGAILAAAALAYHGRRPLLMDIRALPSDQDHIITLFQERGLWGAISKTNHAILRWRDPIYRNVRELAMTYAHEYCLPGGKKSMLSFSKPFSLARYAPKSWVVAPEDLDWLLVDLDTSPHLPVAPRHVLNRRRRASRIEMQAQDVVEWANPAKKKRKKRKARP
ncbi:MAG TPA: hypothetical protein VJR71_15085 [Pseudolabrys sp.]|nr:hypothetical protein [Pseudolabrys sp.]